MEMARDRDVQGHSRDARALEDGVLAREMDAGVARRDEERNGGSTPTGHASAAHTGVE